MLHAKKWIGLGAAVVLLSAASGFAGGYLASGLHPGPAGKDAQIQGCWNITLGDSTTLRKYCFHDRIGP